MKSQKQSRHKIWFVLLLLISYWGCKRIIHFPDEPEIQSVSASKNFLTSGDSLTIQISFTDGDGDIGKPDGYSSSNRLLVSNDNCFLGMDGTELADSSNGVNLIIAQALITDSRTGCSLCYEIPEIPEKGNVKAISGNMYFKVYSFCNSMNSFDTVVYSIKILDRKENFSKPVSAPPVIIKCR